MRHTDHTTPSGGLDTTRSLVAVMPAAAHLPDGDPYFGILAEFLLVAAPSSRWFRPDHDPQPGREVTRIFDGAFQYERVNHEGGRADAWRKIDPADEDGRFEETCAWSIFAGKIVVDATQPRVGSFKINNPSPGGPVADWQSTTPGGVALMLTEALEVLRDRIAAGTADGVIGSQWTPDTNGPILMVALGPRQPRFATAGDQAGQQ